MERPLIATAADGMEYCVLVTWPNGAESRINHFATAKDAQRWIDRESESWVIRRANPPSPPTPEEKRDFIASIRGPCIRPSVAECASGDHDADGLRTAHD
jgi:hypothetical protein